MKRIELKLRVEAEPITRTTTKITRKKKEEKRKRITSSSFG